MFEHKQEPLVGRRLFIMRMVTYLGFSTVIIVVSLAIGILGYHWTEHMSWIDALLNASMLLGGMGPIATPQTVAGKLFASFYALFSGVVFLVAVGVLIAPVFHRFLHHFHVASEDVEQTPEDENAANQPGTKR